MSRDLIIVYTAAHPWQAGLLRNLLADYGIEATVRESAFAEDPTNVRSQPQVLVPREHVVFALEVARDFEAQQQRSSSPADRALRREPLELPHWRDWPTCPHCHERRPTACPGCQSRGADFPLAEFVTDAAGDHPVRWVADRSDDPHAKVFLACPTCDEIFEPRFPRRCARCGHDFGDGVEPPASALRPDDELNRHAISLLAVLACIVFATAIVLALAWSRR